MDNNNHKYFFLFLTVIFLSLSVVGLYMYLQLPRETAVVKTFEAEPTVFIPTPTIVDVSVSPTSKLSPTRKPSPVPQVTDYQSQITIVPTPTFKTLTMDEEKFSVVYPSYRILYHDIEGSGNRYTLYSASGNIAIHVGSDWSWTYPERQFTTGLTISGQPTFVYDISSQTIVDFQKGGLNYTVQCVHNNSQSLKDECSQLLKDFKLI